MSRQRRGVTLVEVLIALVIVSAAVIPVVTFSMSSARKAAFGEFHIFFQVRAVRLIEHYSLFSYHELLQLADGADGTIRVSLEDPPLPPEFQRKLQSSFETLQFVELEPGLGRLTATMRWVLPVSPSQDPKTSRHSFVLTRLVTDKTLSLRSRSELEY